MRGWEDDSDDELERADDLLGQADALLRRHRGDATPASPRTPSPGGAGPAEPADAAPAISPATMQAFDDDDLPILTEVVDDLDLPAEIFQPVEAPFAAAAVASTAAMPSFVRSLAAAQFTPAGEPAASTVRDAAPEPVTQPEPPATPAGEPAASTVRDAAPEPVTQPEPPAPQTPHPQPAPSAAESAAASPPARSAAAQEQQLAERLVELDTAIAREIDEWAARELPQIIARELERLGERIQDEALAHLRATLLPGISARVSSLFDDRPHDVPPAR
ncbi:MAG: hypothetical protein OSW71_18100 [Proteobacteria bacterium]|nr:hypothetical protein [Pseudomonadota bacterium]